jgi:hypothetical protein
MDSLELKYSSAKLGGGYFVEIVQGQSTQGAFNLIRSRVPDAQFNGIVIRPAAPAPPATPAAPHRRGW